MSELLALDCTFINSASRVATKPAKKLVWLKVKVLLVVGGGFLSLSRYVLHNEPSENCVLLLMEMIQSMFQIIFISTPLFLIFLTTHTHSATCVFSRLYYFSLHWPGNTQDMIQHIHSISWIP